MTIQKNGKLFDVYQGGSPHQDMGWVEIYKDDGKWTRGSRNLLKIVQLDGVDFSLPEPEILKAVGL